MKRLLVLLAVALVLAACGQDPVATKLPTTPAPTGQESTTRPSESNPEQTQTAVRSALLAWMQAETDGDCDQVKALVTQPNSIDCDAVAQNKGLWREFLDLDHSAFQVSVFDESAFVEVAELSGLTGVWDLVWLDGDWLIVIDTEDA